MIRIRQMRPVQYAAVLLLLAMYVLPAACAAKGEPKPVPPPARTIVVFPFEDAAPSPVESLGVDLQKSIQAELSATGAYWALVFSEQLPSVQRALIETTLKKDELKGPFGLDKDQVATALKIGRQIAAEVILVGSIDEVSADAAKHTAGVTLTAMLVDVATGEAKTIAVTGSAPATTTATTAAELIAVAAGDAVTKISAVLAPVEMVRPPTQAPAVKKRSGTRNTVLGLLLGLAVGLIAAGKNVSTSPSSDDRPPVWTP